MGEKGFSVLIFWTPTILNVTIYWIVLTFDKAYAKDKYGRNILLCIGL